MAKDITPSNYGNSNRNFVAVQGEFRTELMPIVASVAIEQGTAIGKAATSGNYTVSGNNEVIGYLDETIATTDTDYATAGKLKSVRIPVTDDSVVDFSVGAGTFAADDVGKSVAIHTDSKSIAVDTAGTAFYITNFISSTRGKGRFLNS